ncbi:dihydroorotase [Mycolicibacterium agri]|uniref:Amidohydrolase n=1 Tax=Mycolicibacterium agri TaxID=36811 RepID=A0A7I9VZ26_MYCAG|nr:dihydroorotase family protein [Mycolicibacterium agri]GFG50712.1 amidohydrolase [Mycolicibacterium agri]
MVTGNYDLVVSSSTIVTPNGRRSGQIGVRQGRIVTIHDDKDPVKASRRIEAGDRPVIPGVIDTHVHFRDPGFTHKEDFESGTRAAAAGGVTTVFDMPNVMPPTTNAAALRSHLENAAAKAVVDFGHNASAAEPDNIAELAAAGATAFKIWMMPGAGGSMKDTGGTSVTDRAVLYRIFEEVHRTGLPLYVHPHDHELYNLFANREKQRSGRDFRAYARAVRGGDSVILNTGVAVALEMQRSVGTRLHVLHVASRESARLVRAAKDLGRAVTAEANPYALFVTNDWSNIERLGPYALNVWTPERDAEALWAALDDGTIDVVASDHGPHTSEEKEVGWTDMFSAPAGTPFVEHYLRLFLTAVNAGRITLERVVELCCTNPAKLTGLEGRKGSIAPGADADLVVLDMDHEEVLAAANSHYRCGWASTEGMRTVGAPVITIRRGEVIMRDGKVDAEAGSGRLVTPCRGPWSER